MKIPITQSAEWQKLQTALGEKYHFKSHFEPQTNSNKKPDLSKSKGYQYLAIRMHTPVGNYLYCPYGPYATDEQSFHDAIKDLQALGREEGDIFIRIEPKNPSFATHLPKNAKKSKDLSPKDTWLLDLTPDQSQILTNFSQGTRTRYNTYRKKGLVVERTTDPSAITHLVSLQNKLYKTKHLNSFSERYLRTELEQPFASLYLVKYDKSQDQTRQQPQPHAKANNTPTLYPKDGQILAASLFFDHSGTRYYMQSAADTDFKRLPATVALLTSAIFDAKEQGITTFDFWGIAPDGADKDHPWYGFTEFKKSFGGYPEHYAGTYDLVLKPAKYKLYHSTRHLGRTLHRRTK